MFNYAKEPQAIGQNVGDGFSLYQQSLTKILPIAAILALIGLISLLGQRDPATMVPGEFHFSFVRNLLIPVIVMLVSSIIAAALFHALDDFANERDINIKRSFQSVMTKVSTILVVSIIVAIAISVGMIIFIIPGIFLAILFVPYLPIIIFEDANISTTFKRCTQLVLGNWWRTLMILLVPSVSAGILSWIAFFLIGRHNLALQALMQFIVTAAIAPWASATILVIYNDLKLRTTTE